MPSADIDGGIQDKISRGGRAKLGERRTSSFTEGQTIGEIRHTKEARNERK